jgi:hypothetical protein
MVKRMTSGRRGIVVVLAAAVSLHLLSTVSVAGAQQRSDAERANAMFEEGKQLMAAQRYREACQRFEGSEAALASGRALLNLADCLEKDGRFAGAWTKFQACAARARAAGLADMEKYANDRAAALAPRVARLVLSPAEADAATLSIAVDGQPVDRSLWVGFPVDPGAHAVVATSQGKTWTGNPVADAAGGRVTVAIPAFEVGLAEPTVVPAVPSQEPSGGVGGTRRAFAIVLGAAGVVVLGGGIFLGLSAKSTYDDANPYCPTAMLCRQPGVDDRGSADTKADFSTAAFIAAGAALAGSAVLWFTAPSRSSITVGVTPAGVTLRGSL